MMNSEVRQEHQTKESQPTQRSTDTADYVVRVATAKDDAALGQLISVPMTTRGVEISFQREPSYFKASDVVYFVKDHTVVENIKTKELVACCSNGYRPCYVNGQVQAVRYACDLRVAPNQRGKLLVSMLGDQMRATMHNPDFNQIIIFNDNLAARAAIQTGKMGIPTYYDDHLIETLTLTGFKSASLPEGAIDDHIQHVDFKNRVKVVPAQSKHIDEMNHFIERMAAFYNFIPAYDFKQLQNNHAYYHGLALSDFHLFYQNNVLVGIFGLWSQSSFKQTKILNYSRMIGLIRPFYNLWANWTGRMPLPSKGESIRYHVLHSLLCQPDHLQLHDFMLRTAMNLSREKQVGRIAFTLALNDPRQKLNQYYKGERLTGMHGFLSFKEDPRTNFDANRISYLECGRI